MNHLGGMVLIGSSSVDFGGDCHPGFKEIISGLD
jgi:hypothetical protein